jgi:hypothetical protein
VTDAFEAVARRLLKSLGYPDVPVIVTPAPVVYLEERAIHDRVDTLLDPIRASFDAPLAS